MRDIRFRGRSVMTGAWKTGFLLRLPSGSHIIVQDLEKYINNGFQYPEDIVDKETVGQFTGLKDIHGNDIYEGDTVEFDVVYRGRVSATYRGQVVHDDGSACFRITNPEHTGDRLGPTSEARNIRIVPVPDGYNTAGDAGLVS